MPHGTCSHPPNPRFALIAVLAALLAAGCLSGCSRGMFTPTGVRLRSHERPVEFGPVPTAVAYIDRDTNTADIYLTDFSRAELAADTPLGDVTGTILHVHMFMRPRPGRTPIETTASTVSFRCAVIAGGQVGVYGGGGFLFPSGEPGDASFGGIIRNASARLLAGTPGFVDRLGAARLDASLNAPRDPALAKLIDRRLDLALRAAGTTAADTVSDKSP